MKNIDYSLYLCLGNHFDVQKICQEAILGGVSVVQMREKMDSSLELFNLACRLKSVCDVYDIPLIINDRLDIALSVGADGVHLGQEDLPCREARKILKNQVIGVSVSNVREAIQAQEDGANYLGVGAMFSTSSKTNAKLVSHQELKKIREATTLPIVLIGGLNSSNICAFGNMGIEGIAVISAILNAKNPKESAKQLRTLWKKLN